MSFKRALIRIRVKQTSGCLILSIILNEETEKTATGLAPRTSPAGWTWHHSKEAGVMQLVPRTQHTPGSIF